MYLKLKPNLLCEYLMTRRKTNIEFVAELQAKNIKLNVAGEYVNKRTKIKVSTKYGDVLMFPHAILRGDTPTIRAAINKPKFFIEQAKEIHGDKYDYSKTYFEKSAKNVTIFCPVHGDFTIRPTHHLEGAGCSKCSKMGRYSVKLANKYKSYWSEVPAIVYTIRCWNDEEEFYKIGITTSNPHSRFSNKMPYEYNVVQEINTNLYNACYIETNLHSMFESYSYTPNIEFSGRTECFSQVEVYKN